MTDKRFEPYNLTWWLVLAALLIAVSVIKAAYGDEGHGHDHHDGGDVTVPVDVFVSGATSLVSGGDVSTGGNTTYALAPPGLGDVAIARCLGSEAWTLLIGGKQKLVLNHVCMAEFYLKLGAYDLAAQALCNQPEILAEYTTEVACEIDHDFSPPKVEGEDKFDHDVHSRSDEYAEAYAQQEHEIEFLQEENASIVGRLDDLTALLEQAPAPATVYIQQESEPKYTDADIAYVLGLFTDEEPDDE